MIPTDSEDDARKADRGVSFISALVGGKMVLCAKFVQEGERFSEKTCIFAKIFLHYKRLLL